MNYARTLATLIVRGSDRSKTRSGRVKIIVARANQSGIYFGFTF
ncbi:hypothetical protein [Fusobacterium necrophorum]|nr:hypothetical protein [Fusobacterium necrophorum]